MLLCPILAALDNKSLKDFCCLLSGLDRYWIVLMLLSLMVIITSLKTGPIPKYGRGEPTCSPKRGRHTDLPVGANLCVRPKEGRHTDLPVGANLHVRPKEGRHTDLPVGANLCVRPKEGRHTDLPVGANPPVRPKEGRHMGLPLRDNQRKRKV